MSLSAPVKPLRVLSWDVENRPLSYLGQDFTTGEITAIAWSWSDPDAVDVLLLQRDGTFRYNDNDWPLTPAMAFCMFSEVLRQADVVSGHYIVRHDVPMFNAALMEVGLPPLAPMVVSDTKEDLVKRKYLSASQEALAGMLGVPASKYHMTQAMWRAANRLEPEGIALTRKRVVDDVIQHIALRKALLAQRLLKAPRRWSP